MMDVILCCLMLVIGGWLGIQLERLIGELVRIRLQMIKDSKINRKFMDQFMEPAYLEEEPEMPDWYSKAGDVPKGQFYRVDEAGIRDSDN